MKLPTISECEQLFQQYHVPKNIHQHCIAVSNFAFSLSVKLKKKGIPINTELVKTAALMHDWMKAVSLDSLGNFKGQKFTISKEEIDSWQSLKKRFSGMHETEITFKLLKDTYPEFAAFVKREGSLSFDLNKSRSWEEKVCHYSDWRFIGTQQVPLNVRIEDLRERYADKIKIGGMHNFNMFADLERKAEKEICDALNCKPEDL